MTAGHWLPFVDFTAEADCCPVCGGRLNIRKTSVRLVTTLSSGSFLAHEVQKMCAHNADHFCGRSDALAHIVPPRQRYGFDLIVYVGIARYLRLQQRDEIRRELFEQRAIELSSGTVSYLCDRFLLYFEVLHLVRSPHFKAAMQQSGYALHFDATCDRGKGGLFVCIDGVRKWVLVAGRIDSESEQQLRPFIERTVELFGDPRAVVRDMGRGGQRAVGFLVERGILDFVCHYHFLGRIGDKLFDNPYGLLCRVLKQYGIQTQLHQLQRDLNTYATADFKEGRFGPKAIRQDLRALVYWLINGDGKKDPAYPFSLPHLNLYQRCQIAEKKADDWIPNPRTTAEKRALAHLSRLMKKLEKDNRLKDAAIRLEKAWQLFDQTREVLRLTDAELPRGDRRNQEQPGPQREEQRRKQIEDEVKKFCAKLTRQADEDNPKRPKTPQGVVLKYFQKYDGKLFGHPTLCDPDDNKIAVVERTNNTSEHFFGKGKQNLRRRVGRSQLGRDLQDQPAQAALVANLNHPDYVRILCGSIDNLANAIANLEKQTLYDATPLVRSNRNTILQKRVQQLINQIDTTSP